MLRDIATLGVVAVCLVSAQVVAIPGTIRLDAASVGKTTSQHLPYQDITLYSQSDPEKSEQYIQQARAAVGEIVAARLHLEEQLESLLKLQPRYLGSADLDQSISSLQELLTSVRKAQQEAVLEIQKIQETTQAAQTGTPPSIGDSNALTVAERVDVLRQMAVAAQSSAAQGSTLATQAIAGLATPADGSPSQSDKGTRGRHGHRLSYGGGVSLGIASPSPPQLPDNSSNSPDETTWFNKLTNGLLQYRVPDTMLWRVQSTVTIQINGEKAPAPAAIDHQNGQALIKVSRYMKVLVSAPDNPDEFTIAPESDTQLKQYVPEDGPTTWHFSVTPRYTAKAQKLVVQAWVIYDENTQRELPVYIAKVNVHVPSVGECLKRLIEGDPDYWLKYGLPGGAGFIFFSGLVTGLWKWLKKKKA